MKFLISKGVDINIRDVTGNSPLDYAKVNREELVPWLIAQGEK